MQMSDIPTYLLSPVGSQTIVSHREGDKWFTGLGRSVSNSVRVIELDPLLDYFEETGRMLPTQKSKAIRDFLIEHGRLRSHD